MIWPGDRHSWVVAKADDEYLRCAEVSGHGDRWLVVPIWMFELALYPADLRLTVTPSVSLDALAELSVLLDRARKTSMGSSKAPVSGAFRSFHNQIRKEVHASGDGDGAEQWQVQAVARASDGSVRQRQAGGRRRAALVGVAGASALGDDGAYSEENSRSRSHSCSASSEGGRR